MIRILLKKRFLYERPRGKDYIEQAYRYTFLDIGFKGSIYFISIIQEDIAETILYASMLWHSNF